VGGHSEPKTHYVACWYGRQLTRMAAQKVHSCGTDRQFAGADWLTRMTMSAASFATSVPAGHSTKSPQCV
jgi:hypothetical protein